MRMIRSTNRTVQWIQQQPKAGTSDNIVPVGGQVELVCAAILTFSEPV